MKLFRPQEVEQAVAHAVAGGQALHVHRIIGDRTKAPACFVRAVEKGEYIAHLFDQDPLRLASTARRLGVKTIVVEREGTDRQHVDLCGSPLRRAMEEAGAS